METFERLGSLVERLWRERNYDDDALPDIASDALAESSLIEHLSPWEIIRWLNRTKQLPEQRDIEGRFGNPPITLYNGPRFYIDAYYWLDGTTSIHQHGFCGAFQVFAGSSILSQYRFEKKKQINAHFHTGNVTLKNVELLEQGDIRRIPPGDQYIHSLFHLDRPSVSIIIRTQQSPSGLPQYNYLRPYFALDPYYAEPLMIKRVQSASLLLKMQHPDADEFIAETLSNCDFHTAYAILDLAFKTIKFDALQRVFGISTGSDRFDSYIELARRRHGDLVDLILPVLEESQRQRYLVARRGMITGSEHRFLLALLLNVPDRKKVIELVKERFPEEDPVELITDWIEELANTRTLGSPEQNVLGIENIDNYYLLVLQYLLEGRSLEQAKADLVEAMAEEPSEDVTVRVERLYDHIRNSMLFRSIFLDPPVAAAAQLH